MAILEWEGGLNGAPFNATQTIDFSNELPRGGVLAVDFGFRTIDIGVLSTLTLSWSWTDPAGVTQNFTAADLSLLSDGSLVGGFRMLKAPRDAIPGALFSMTMTKGGLPGAVSWDGWMRIP